MLRCKVSGLLPLLLLVLMGPAWAHQMPTSAVLLDFRSGTVDAELQLPVDRLQYAFEEALTNDASAISSHWAAPLQEYILTHVRPTTPDGRPWTTLVSGLKLQGPLNARYVIASLSLRPPAGAPVNHLILHYDVITHQIVTHRVLVSVRSDWKNAVFATKPVMTGVLSGQTTSIVLDRSNGSALRGLTAVIALGIDHIAEGSDHLLFLLALLLPAPLLAKGGRWREYGGARHGLTSVLKVVTAFTVGHSLTLLAGAMGWVRVPSAAVELFIAVSILVSALHALRPLFPGREAAVAALFGLVHGMAFASAISGMGLDARGMVISLFGFNLGIELMQLGVVLAVMPSLIVLSKTRLYPAVRIAGGSFAAIAAAGWIVERGLGRANPVAPAVDSISRNAVWWVVALATAALVVIMKRVLTANRGPGRVSGAWTALVGRPRATAVAD